MALESTILFSEVLANTTKKTMVKVKPASFSPRQKKTAAPNKESDANIQPRRVNAVI
jgi:hypothetical protein